MAPDLRRKERSAAHTRRAQEGPWREDQVGNSVGGRTGAGEEPPALLGLPEKSWPHSVPGSSFQSWSPFGPQIRARSLHNLFLDWKAWSGDLLERLKSMVMRARQLRSGGHKGPHKMATILAFSNGSFQPGHTQPSPQQPQLDSDPVFPSCPYYSMKTQPSGLDNGMDLIEAVQEIRNSP